MVAMAQKKKRVPLNLSHLRRFDSNETSFLVKELESVDPQEYETLFAGLYGRDYFPTIEGVNPAAQSYNFKSWEPVGVARAAAPGANDARTVQVIRRENVVTIKSITDSYGWNIDEIRGAAMAGTPLDKQLATEAMMEIARKIDNMIAFGETGTTITGMLNNAGIDATTTPITKTGGGTPWSDLSLPDEWIKDVNKLITVTRDRLKQAAFSSNGGRQPAFNKFVVLLPQVNYNKAAQTPRTSTSDTTVLRYLLQNNPFIESIEEWYQLDTAGASSSGRMMVYPRDARWGGALVPIDFESLPPQENDFDINVPCRGKCGGGVVRYPVAASYMDGI
jgi:hypothetical protein